MRTAILCACLFILPSLALAAGETHFYGPQGQYQGRATTNTANPQQKSLYTNDGRYVGRAMTGSDGTVRIYDQHGNYRGRTSERGQNIKR